MVNTGSLVRLSTEEFQRLSALVYAQCGINLQDAKKIMLECRLNKRLRVLQISSFKEYIQLLSSPQGISEELGQMIDVVTTNKTDFFREQHHFDFLQQTVLPQFVKERKRGFKVWSAACSTGEEPYTLAMVCQDFAAVNLGFDYRIFATDISTDVLQKAVQAVYSMDRVINIPLAVKQKYFLKSKDTVKPAVRIIPELRKKVNYAHINLMDKMLSTPSQFDIIFCRNVLIYFDRQTQEEVIRKLANKLVPDGYLFIGHSESLLQMDLPLTLLQQTIYKKK